MLTIDTLNAVASDEKHENGSLHANHFGVAQLVTRGQRCYGFAQRRPSRPGCVLFNLPNCLHLQNKPLLLRFIIMISHKTPAMMWLLIGLLVLSTLLATSIAQSNESPNSSCGMGFVTEEMWVNVEQGVDYTCYGESGLPLEYGVKDLHGSTPLLKKGRTLHLLSTSQ